MKLHVICGLPRSGSTLLCNVLNQNPRFRASSTSGLAHTISALGHLWSRMPETKSDLAADRRGTEERMVRVLRAVCRGWYGGEEDCVIFDKGRVWNHQALVLHSLFPDAKMLVCVRDLRDIFASIERHHQRMPYLDEANNQLERTAYSRADRMFGPDGIIGAPITGVEDLLRRRLPFVHVVQFETLASSPDLVLDRIYSALGEPRYAHDVADVKNVATDADAFYLNKYPHEGSGAIMPPEGHWRDVVPDDIAQLIMQRFNNYNRSFGYQ